MTPETNIPKHVAIVLDGNGRWAKAKHLPRFMGHKKGVEAVREIVKTCGEFDVECLTLFAFSSENWKRPEDEVNKLMGLFMLALDREAKSMAKNNVRLHVIGDLSHFSEKLQAKIKDVEKITEHCTGLFLNIAANYGGRWDITQAMKSIAEEIKTNTLTANNINEDIVSAHLTISDLPDPDLFIRTGGEKRISNFLIWQMAYTELYFTDVLWPDFDKRELEKAIIDFSSRQRRFGKTSEQVAADKKLTST